jgi:hypothetical protein
LGRREKKIRKNITLKFWIEHKFSKENKNGKPQSLQNMKRQETSVNPCKKTIKFRPNKQKEKRKSNQSSRVSTNTTYSSKIIKI